MNMKTIQVVLDRKLLEATNRAARRTKRNRSALIRDALRGTLEMRAREERDHAGYLRQPQAHHESLVWEAEVVPLEE